jgi:two-component system CheB/CheR fusion protein
MEKNSSQPTPEMIVGVGASAGGLNAFEEFLQGIPQEAGFGYVLVQHLDPNHESELPDLLQSVTDMRVETVVDDMAVRPNCIYVIPPGKSLEIDDGGLQLRSPDEARGRRMPIDLFLRSLAEDRKSKSACVILSGTGSDGSLGLKAIKEAGGVCLVQDPSDAECDGMPRAAIATGLVDIVATARECGAKLAAFVDSSQPIPVPGEAESPVDLPDEEQHLSTIFDLVESHSGYDFSAYKPNTIWRRIRHRTQIRQVESLPEYVRLLENDPSERQALVRDFLISVTNFFRDQETFEALERTAIPQIFEQETANDAIRVWVPGCATGEEAYSLLMLLREQAHRRNASESKIQLFATDIDEDALRTAREGFYPESITTDVSMDRLKRFFLKEEGGFRIRPEMKEQILFSVHNLLRDPPFSRLNLISCRNLLIYLKREMQERVMRLFHYALSDGGYLFLGRSETPVSLSKFFETVDKSAHIYRARDVEKKYPYPLFKGVGITPGAKKLTPKQNEAPPLQVVHRNAAMERYLPPTILVNEELEVAHVIGDVEDYLRVGPGTPSNNVLEMVRPALRTELRAALFSVFKEGEKTELRRMHLEKGEEAKAVDVIVELLDAEETQAPYALVTFTDQEPIAETDIDSTQAEEVSEKVNHRLEEELESTRRRLQAVTEEYETSNEELLSSNEELQSMNEELRSTMEELETSKEELQSTNEELVTVNQELRSKVEALNKTNSDIKNLMQATEIATLFLDADLNVQRFTPSVTDLFNVITSDEGRPFGHISHDLRYDRFVEDAEEVLDTLRPVEREVQDEDDNWYQVRILPYRTVNDRIDGVVFTFVDVTDLKEAQERLEKTKESLEERVQERTSDLKTEKETLKQRAEQFQTFFRQGPISGAFVDFETGEILDVSDRCLELTGYRRAALVGETLPEAGIVDEGDWEKVEAQTEEGDGVKDKPVLLSTSDGEQIDVRVSIEIVDQKTGVVLFNRAVGNDSSGQAHANRTEVQSEE